MSNWKTEAEARAQIKALVAEYYKNFKETIESKSDFKPGDRISYASRVYDEKEMQSLTDAMLDFWLTTGRFSEKFEREFAEWIGVRYAHLVNSGSSANLLAFMVLTAPELGERQIKCGDEVITVACSFPTTVTPILQYGAVPVFVDVTLPQYNIDVSKLEDALSDRTKAVMIAHTLGNPFDLKAVRRFCKEHDLWLVEDNCDALGSKYTIDGKTQYTGTWGDIGTSSFYPPHHMTMGEGGCIYTDNPLLHRLILSYRDWGRDCVCPSGNDNFCGHRYDGQFGQLPQGYDHKYVYSHFGYNLKVTDLQAAVGVEQLKKFPSFIERRIHNWKRLHKALESIENKIILPEPAENSSPSWFGFLISVRPETGLDRNSVIRYIENHNVQTRLLFSGNLVKQPCFDQIRGTDAYRIVGSLDNTEFITDNTFWVGVYPGMTDEMIDYMAQIIIEAVTAEKSPS
jgi:CDP-6-deoxy-D-xylo-4-hexulose-3-dehydrase